MLVDQRACDATTAVRPSPRGPISREVLGRLGGPPDEAPWTVDLGDADPYGDDVQLALTVLYEVHYRGFEGVDPEWEWKPGPLAVRAALEKLFLGRLREDVPRKDDPLQVLSDLCHEPDDAWGVSHHLAHDGTWEQMREYFVHRSIYHLKEADPQAWALPRLIGREKSGYVAVMFDEYGCGRKDRLHSRLFADLLVGAELHDGYLHYLDRVPGATLATVNIMSSFGLHRSRVPMLVGLFAAQEVTSSPGSRRLVQALHRVGADSSCVEFYAEHVEADAVHEQLLRHDVVRRLVEREPRCAREIAFGIEAGEFLEGRLARHLLDCWSRNESSLTVSRG